MMKKLGRMRYRIDLKKEVVSVDASGIPSTTQTSKTVYADKMSIGQSEFYQAAATGLKPELKFRTRLENYDSETIVGFNSKDYRILKTYEVGKDLIELTLTGLDSNGVAVTV